MMRPALHASAGRKSRLVRIHVRPERDRPAGLHHHIERDRLETRCLDLDAMSSGLEVGVLEYAVKVNADPDVVPARKSLRFARRIRDPQTAIRASREWVVVPARRVPVWIGT